MREPRGPLSTQVVRQVSRRRFLIGVGSGALSAAFLVACGSSEEGSGGGATATAAAPEDVGTAAAGTETAVATPGEFAAFPVTIEHKYGSTTVEAMPQRVVTVGMTDQDAVLALGVIPVGLINWYAEYPNGTWPWAQNALGGATPVVMPRNNDEFLFEDIAAIEPDLIIGQYTGMSGQDYELLSQIAPTVAQSGEYEDWSMPWQDMTRRIGLALGRAEEADEVIAGVEARFAEVREQHPEFASASVIFVERGLGTGASYPRGVAEPRVRVLTDLGFTVPQSIADLAGDYGANLSDEQMSLIDADVVVWGFYEPGVQAELEQHPVYQQLPVHTEGRDIFLQDEVLSGALVWSSVLSLPYALDRLVPMLALAVDGDPATVVMYPS